MTSTDKHLDIVFSNHAIDRFLRRFPGFDLEQSFTRAVKVTTRQLTKLIGRGKAPLADCPLAYHDAVIGAVFGCRHASERPRKLTNAEYICVTVIRANRK